VRGRVCVDLAAAGAIGVHRSRPSPGRRKPRWRAATRIRQVAGSATYAGWPLYTYVTDVGSGTAKGQALNLNGGVWYVISASGTVVHRSQVPAAWLLTEGAVCRISHQPRNQAMTTGRPPAARPVRAR